jgi:hypothetical protein
MESAIEILSLTMVDDRGLWHKLPSVTEAENVGGGLVVHRKKYCSSRRRATINVLIKI